MKKKRKKERDFYVTQPRSVIPQSTRGMRADVGKNNRCTCSIKAWEKPCHVTFFMGSGIVKCADVISLKDLKAFACVCLGKTHRGVAFVCLYDCLCYHRYLHVEVYIHTYISTYMHTDRESDKETDKQTFTHKYTHIHAKLHTYTHTHTNRYTYIQIYTHQNIHTDTCVCIPTTPALPHSWLTGGQGEGNRQSLSSIALGKTTVHAFFLGAFPKAPSPVLYVSGTTFSPYERKLGLGCYVLAVLWKG